MSSSAIQDLLTAAERARNSWNKSAAVPLYPEALDLVDDDEPARRQIRLERGLALVDAGELDTAASELSELLESLSGRDEIEALVALARVTMLLEQTDDAHAYATRALELAEQLGDAEMLGPALAVVSQTTGQRGQEGDLDRAIRSGDRALDVWVEHSKLGERALHATLHALNHYWAGSYDTAVELGRQGRELGIAACNPEAHLDGGATEALALTALGRHGEAIELFEATIARARELDAVSAMAYTLACSTSALRDLLDLDEARHRSHETIDLFGKVGFESGVMQGEMDLLYADIASGEVSRAARAWPGLWERTGDATGWERWLAPGRLAVARAEIALQAEGPEAAVDRAHDAIAIARSIARPKYETCCAHLARNSSARARQGG